MVSIKIEFAEIAFTDGSKEMINILVLGIFDAKFINYRGEEDVTELVEEESWGASGFDIVKSFEMLDKIIICNFASFFENVPSTFYFGINVAINNFMVKVVVADDLRGKIFY